MYGSSDVAGVLASNVGWCQLLKVSLSAEIQRVLAGRPLAGFRPPIDRQQLYVRRPQDGRSARRAARQLVGRVGCRCCTSGRGSTWVASDGVSPSCPPRFGMSIHWPEAWGVQTVGLARPGGDTRSPRRRIDDLLAGRSSPSVSIVGIRPLRGPADATDQTLRGYFSNSAWSSTTKACCGPKSRPVSGPATNFVPPTIAEGDLPTVQRKDGKSAKSAKEFTRLDTTLPLCALCSLSFFALNQETRLPARQIINQRTGEFAGASQSFIILPLPPRPHRPYRGSPNRLAVCCC
jgi:hypothetical protein